MRVTFVDNLLIRQESRRPRFDLQPHLGLISLIGVAERVGHQCRLFDPKLELHRGRLPLDRRLYRSIAEKLLAAQPDAVGFTTLGCNFICTLKTAAHIKKLAPEVQVILGGPHATILDQEILARFPQFDLIVRGESEPILARLLDNLANGHLESIPGLTFRRGSEVVSNPPGPVINDLDSLPFSAYHHYPIEELKLTSLRVEAGRGCPFECTFCSTASFFGRSHRLKSPRRLCAELDWLNRRYGISDFGLTHDLFTVNRHKVRAFCEEVEGRNYTWSCSARIDCVDAALLERMHSAGCRSIYYGVETGSPRMQRISAKRLDLALFDPILDETQRLGIRATASFIMGYPEERPDDQGDTLDLIASCFARPQELVDIQLHLLTPEPGTRLYRDYASSLAYDGHVSDFNFPTLEPDDGTIMRANPSVFMNHHYYPCEVPRCLNILITSAFGLLVQFGFPLVRHILDHYQGRLSLLMRRMGDWAHEAGHSASLSADLIAEFFAAEWGEQHSLTSLVRHATAALKLLESQETDPACGPRSASRQPEQDRLRLTPKAAVLRDMHDCGEILRRLAAGEELPGKLLNDRMPYLVLLDAVSGRSVRNFVISGGLADLLDLIQEPRSRASLLDLYGERVEGGRSELEARLDQLIEFGVVEIVQDPVPSIARGPGERSQAVVQENATWR